MKYMHYKMKQKRGYEILDEGKFYSYALDEYYYYFILSYFTHPCAYVKIPINHPFYKKSYDKIPIDCHGGLTYSKDCLLQGTPDEQSGWWIGWDYAHYNDYAPYHSEAEATIMGLHKWTTAEIFEEVREVIGQLINFEERLI